MDESETVGCLVDRVGIAIWYRPLLSVPTSCLGLAGTNPYWKDVVWKAGLLLLKGFLLGYGWGIIRSCWTRPLYLSMDSISVHSWGEASKSQCLMKWSFSLMGWREHVPILAQGAWFLILHLFVGNGTRLVESNRSLWEACPSPVNSNWLGIVE